MAMLEPVKFNPCASPSVVSPIRGATNTASIQSKGFTLLEVLITLVILSVALLALAGLMATTVKNNAYGETLTEATTMAQDKLEEFKATPWTRLLPTTPGPGTDQRKSSTGINFARTWTIAQNGNVKTITLTVSWADRINHSIRLIAVLSR
jgi:prepilin-type N-terminal cleavage/methylation domain-containing protein